MLAMLSTKSCRITGSSSSLLLLWAQPAGGTSPMDRNSQNYSALKTPAPPGSKLPQIVVQMPVYKESLEEVRGHPCTMFMTLAVGNNR